MVNKFIEEKIFKDSKKKVGFYIIVYTVFSVLICTFDAALVIRLTNNVKYIALMFFLINTFGSISLILTPRFISSSNISKIFRTAFIIQFFMCIYLIFFFKNLGNLWILFIYFAFRGIYEGIFWFGRHTGILFGVNDSERNSFFLKLQTYIVSISFIFPLISGFIISYIKTPGYVINKNLPNGYLYIYILASIFVFFVILVSPKLKSSRRVMININNIIALLKNKKIRTYRWYIGVSIIQNATWFMCISVLNFLVLKTEFNLGIFTSIISISGALFFIVVRKLKIKNENLRLNFVLIGTIGEVISRSIYFFFFSFSGLIFKSFLDTLIVPFKTLFGETISKKKMEDINASMPEISIQEIVIFQEIIVLICRTILIGLIFIILNINGLDPVKVFQIILILTGLGSILEYFLLRKIIK